MARCLNDGAAHARKTCRQEKALLLKVKGKGEDSMSHLRVLCLSEISAVPVATLSTWSSSLSVSLHCELLEPVSVQVTRTELIYIYI